MAASFTIQAVSERTGLTPHVIRAWERRYRAIEPARSSGRHRLYSEDEIERLLLLQEAVRGGHSIGQVAALPNEKLRELGNGAHALPPASAQKARAHSLRREVLEAVEHFRAPALQETLQRGLITLGQQGLLRLLVAPLAQEVGDRWRAGELTAAHEHFYTAATKSFLGALSRQFALAENAPRIVVATPDGQLHELGAVLVAAEAANLGWNVIYLGPSLPAAEIAGAAERNQAAAVALSIVYPEDDELLPNELEQIAQLLPPQTRLLAGGRAAGSYLPTLLKIGALYADNLAALSEKLETLRRRPR